MYPKSCRTLMGVATIAIVGISFMPAAIALPTIDQGGILMSQTTSVTSDLPMSDLPVEPTADPSIGAMKAKILHVTPSQSTILVQLDNGETRYLNVPRGEGDRELNAGDEKVFLMRGNSVVGILDPDEYTAYDSSSSPAEEARAAVRARYEEMRQSRETTQSQTTTVQRQEPAPVVRSTVTETTVTETTVQPVRGLW